MRKELEINKALRRPYMQLYVPSSCALLLCTQITVAVQNSLQALGGGVSPESLLFRRMSSHWCTIMANNRQPATMFNEP